MLQSYTVSFDTDESTDPGNSNYETSVSTQGLAGSFLTDVLDKSYHLQLVLQQPASTSFHLFSMQLAEPELASSHPWVKPSSRSI